MESWIRLIRVMTHEIMNSIAPVTSLTETLLFAFKASGKEPKVSAEDTIEALETIHTTAKGLISFVESYRKFTGIPQPNKQAVALLPLIETVLKLSQESLEEKKIQVALLPFDEQFAVYADESQIKQVLVNLIKNAIEALPGGGSGQLQIRCSVADGRLRLDIANNGQPIPEEIVPHIFVPFFTTKDSGSGIGLSVSRYIMRLHGGNLKHYTSEDRRTVFSMSL